MPYVLRLIAISSKPGWFEEEFKIRRHEAMEAAGINEWQGTPWSEELDGKLVEQSNDKKEEMGIMFYLFRRGVIKRTPPGEIFQNELGLGQTSPSVIVIFYPIPQRVPFVYILMKSTFCPSSLPPTVE